MKFKVGDKVRFLHETGSGVVTRLIDGNKVMVRTSDGFEIPSLVNQLVDAKGDQAMGKEEDEDEPVIVKPKQLEKPQVKASEKPNTVQKKEPIKKFVKPRPLLAIVPTAELAIDKAEYNIYLINDSSYTLSYFIGLKNSNINMLDAGVAEPETLVFIDTIKYKDLIAFQTINTQLLLYTTGEHDYFRPIEYIFDINSINWLRGSLFVENDFLDEPALLLEIKMMEEVFKDKSVIKTEEFKKDFPVENKKIQKPIEEEPKKEFQEIDLHIENLVDDHSNMESGEIIQTQLARFTIALEGAIKNNEKKIVFIHGLGNGKLKYEVRKAIDQKYPDLYYQDASFAEYGFGATMVYLKK